MKLFLLFFFVFPLSVNAQQSLRHIPVTLKVTTNDIVKSQIESYTRRALRDLRDVEIVDTKAQYILQITVTTAKTYGKITGYYISCLVLMPCDSFVIENLLPDLDPATRSTVTARLNGTIFYLRHWAEIGPPEELKDMMESIVAEFDVGVLEPFRKSLLK